MRNSSGQVLLITLLVLTVMITIGLALIGRTRTDVTSTAEVEESARAFSAAEAGIEDALKSGVDTGQNPKTLSGGLTTYSTSITAVGASAGSFSFPQLIQKGETETLWLVPHNADQTLQEVPTYTNDTIDICWKGAGSSIPALVVTVLWKYGTVYRIAKAALDPDSTRQNNFDSNNFALQSGCDQANVYMRTINFPALGINPTDDIILALRIRPLYADAFAYIDSGNVVLPSQGNVVTSSGSTGTGVTRKIVVTQQFRSPLSVFDAAVVSQQNFYR